jgi:hypothetical protein
VTTWRILRYGLGAAGLAALAFGVTTLLTDPQVGDWQGVVEWLALAVVLHDGVLVPVVLLSALALGARLRRRLRWPFVVAGSLTAVALPVLLRPGAPANPSVLPLDYQRGWVVSVSAVVGLALCWAAGKWSLGRVQRGNGRIASGCARMRRGRTGGGGPV